MEDNIVGKFIWDSTMGEPQFTLPISLILKTTLRCKSLTIEEIVGQVTSEAAIQTRLSILFILPNIWGLKCSLS